MHSNSNFSNTLQLAQELIRQASITPNDKGCQKILAQRLEAIGFSTQALQIEGVQNLWAFRPADTQTSNTKLLCFAGHTDVVPTGSEQLWAHPPFAADIIDGVLHGRGSADMEGGLAAMLTAVEEYVAKHQQLQHNLAFLITSDEEGVAQHGTKALMPWLQERGIHIDWCVIGEPSSTNTVGDVIRIGRRGSLSAYLTIKGKQGHVAYPNLAENAISKALTVLKKLDNLQWDSGSEQFPATSFQISQLHAGEADNIIPGTLKAHFNLRYNDLQTVDSMQNKISDVLNQANVAYALQWQHSGAPFLTNTNTDLVKSAQRSIQSVQGIEVELSTGGGTSDGRFIAPSGAQVIELGLRNYSIHKINEQVTVKELNQLHALYVVLIENLFR